MQKSAEIIFNGFQFGSWTYPKNLLSLEILDNNDNSTNELNNIENNETIVVSDGIGLI